MNFYDNMKFDDTIDDVYIRIKYKAEIILVISSKSRDYPGLWMKNNINIVGVDSEW